VLAILAGHSEAILHAAWNSDESRILTASGDRTVRQWYTRMEDLLLAACQQVPRNMTREEWGQFMGDEPYQLTCPNLDP
jgi:WD40 repeat protein